MVVPGDTLLAVNGTNVVGQSVEEVMPLLRSQAAPTRSVTFRRSRQAQLKFRGAVYHMVLLTFKQVCGLCTVVVYF